MQYYFDFIELYYSRENQHLLNFFVIKKQVLILLQILCNYICFRF
jgi:hypothetical protein